MMKRRVNIKMFIININNVNEKGTTNLPQLSKNPNLAPLRSSYNVNFHHIKKTFNCTMLENIQYT